LSFPDSDAHCGPRPPGQNPSSSTVALIAYHSLRDLIEISLTVDRRPIQNRSGSRAYRSGSALQSTLRMSLHLGLPLLSEIVLAGIRD
jgi:hypothetical protein